VGFTGSCATPRTKLGFVLSDRPRQLAHLLGDLCFEGERWMRSARRS
jgi:hypothetical protein